MLGTLVLPFLSGSEIGTRSFRGHWKARLSIGFVSFALPFLAAFGFCGLVLGWSLHAAEIGGGALRTTSVAVVFPGLVENRVDRRGLGKLLRGAGLLTCLGPPTAPGGQVATCCWLRGAF